MAQLTLNNSESLNVIRTKLNANFTELYGGTILAPVSHASSSTTYGVGTNTNYGHVKVTNANGLSISSGTVALALGNASTAGAVKLVDSYSSTDTSAAPTAKALKDGLATMVVTYYGTGDPSSETGKDNDIYFKIV